jgi:hypothetical protein
MLNASDFYNTGKLSRLRCSAVVSVPCVINIQTVSDADEKADIDFVWLSRLVLHGQLYY